MPGVLARWTSRFPREGGRSPRPSGPGARAVAVALALLASAGGSRVASTRLDGAEPGAGGGYRFSIPEVEGVPGESVTVTIEGSHEEAIQGFSIALRYPAGRLSVERVHARDTIVEAVGADFLEAVDDPVAGTLVVGVLVDVEPPFDGAVIPNVRRPLPFLHVEARLDPSLEEDLELELENGLSTPPIDNAFVVDNQIVLAEGPTRGRIRLARHEEVLFIRGDANLDRRTDLSDAILILTHQFRGTGLLECLDAGDVNDDRIVDLSDAIYLLGFLYLGSSAPPPPIGEPGIDPTWDVLECSRPLEVRIVLGR